MFSPLFLKILFKVLYSYVTVNKIIIKLNVVQNTRRVHVRNLINKKLNEMNQNFYNFYGGFVI